MIIQISCVHDMKEYEKNEEKYLPLLEHYYKDNVTNIRVYEKKEYTWKEIKERINNVGGDLVFSNTVMINAKPDDTIVCRKISYKNIKDNKIENIFSDGVIYLLNDDNKTVKYVK